MCEMSLVGHTQIFDLQIYSRVLRFCLWMSPFGTKVWWTVRLSDDFIVGGSLYSDVKYIPPTGTVVLELMLLVFTRKGGSPYVDD